MDVVEDDHQRLVLGQVGEQEGETLEYPERRWNRLGYRPSHGGDAAQQGGEVVQESAAGPDDRLRGKPPQVALERLRPHGEGGGEGLEAD